MNICFLMYPWDNIKSPENDTTLTLIHECIKRGHGVAICTPANLTIRNSVTNAFCTIINRMEKVPSSMKSFYKQATTREEMLPLAGFDAIFMRAEPPLDPLMLNFLDSVKDDVFIINSVRGMREGNNKLYTAVFEDPNNEIIPVTHVSKNKDYLIKMIEESESDKMIFTISSPQDPGALMIYDEKLGGASLLSAMRPDILASDIGQTIPVSYTARDGESIPAYVTLPVSITETSQLKNLPFIVWPHGGPYARQSLEFDYFAQFFATRGYGVLQMNFRGSAGYGKTFKEAGRENWVVMQEDVEDGTRWLLSNGYADPDRTCIAGWSYGGYAALMGAINHPDLYARAISMAGVTDLKDMITHIKKYRFGKITAANFVLKPRIIARPAAI